MNNIRLMLKNSKNKLNILRRCYSKTSRSITQTVNKTLLDVTGELEQSCFNNAENDAGFIIADALGKKTIENVTENQSLSASQLLEVKRLTKRRKSGMPIQYVIGEWDFRELTLQLCSPVFIPRPETEELVSYALSDSCVNEACHGLEIGCGSGAISLTLLSSLPELRMTAIDCSQAAYDLTQHNSRLLGLHDRLTLHKIQFPEGISEILFDVAGEHFDFLISNPPYVPSADMANLQPEVANFEDHVALHGGPDGMDVIKDILSHASQLVKPEGTIWLEVDSTHRQIISELFSENNYHLKLVNMLNDFRGISRFCHCKVLTPYMTE